MITRIAIESFKGIGERVEIPIRPLTLFFGPNSAGKSTIMHAFHYAREVFERHNLDADRTIAGGDFIDLGGFRNFVHDHNAGRDVCIRFDVDLSDVDLPSYSPGELYISIIDVPWQQELKSAWVEVKIAWDELRGRPFVHTYEVGLNDRRIGWIDAKRTNVVLRYFDIHHPIFQQATEQGEENDHTPFEQLLANALEGVDLRHGVIYETESPDPEMLRETGTYMFDLEQRDALPPCDRPLQVYLGDRSSASPGFDPKSEYAAEQREFLNVLSQVFVGMAEVVRDQLRRFCYLGPLRQKPPREYAPPRFPDPSRWATGLGAWDALYAGNDALLTEVNLWMLREELLNTGYTVWRKDYLQLDPESELYADLASYRAFDEIEDLAQAFHELPHRGQLVLANQAGLLLAIQDVGEGIAQVLPVVVAVLCPEASTVQIEQPELHLHPAQRAALGDLLIRGALGKPSKPIIAETHSEHLVLRVLRRIRETTSNEEPFMGISVLPTDIAVYYVEQEDGQTSVYEIGVGDSGEFLQPWPDKFFDQVYEERYG